MDDGPNGGLLRTGVVGRGFTLGISRMRRVIMVWMWHLMQTDADDLKRKSFDFQAREPGLMADRRNFPAPHGVHSDSTRAVRCL